LRRREGGSTVTITAAILLGILIGVVGYYSVSAISSSKGVINVTTNITTDVATTIISSVTVTVTSTVTSTVTPATTTNTTSEGLYISNVNFSGGNVTIDLGNSGGGIPTPSGYGDTGVTARYIGAIIIQNGSSYYHYNWNCTRLNSSCALAPGPDRYFSLSGVTPSLNESWNLGKTSIIPDILSVGGTMDVNVIFPWTSNMNLTVYIQSDNDSMVYQHVFSTEHPPATGC
jgi:hypothetical protein